MYGKGMGTLNVYQQNEEGKQALIFSQAGDQGRLWRFAQASLLPRVQPYRVSHKDLPQNELTWTVVVVNDIYCKILWKITSFYEFYEF